MLPATWCHDLKVRFWRLLLLQFHNLAEMWLVILQQNSTRATICCAFTTQFRPMGIILMGLRAESSVMKVRCSKWGLEVRKSSISADPCRPTAHRKRIQCDTCRLVSSVKLSTLSQPGCSVNISRSHVKWTWTLSVGAFQFLSKFLAPALSI